MGRPPEKARAVPRNPAEPPDRGRGGGDPGARDLSRTHRERLLRNGFLQEVIEGWYTRAARTSERREHGLVRIVLAFLRRQSLLVCPDVIPIMNRKGVRNPQLTSP